MASLWIVRFFPNGAIAGTPEKLFFLGEVKLSGGDAGALEPR
jgi:hypothetical protein